MTLFRTPPWKYWTTAPTMPSNMVTTMPPGSDESRTRMVSLFVAIEGLPSATSVLLPLSSTATAAWAWEKILTFTFGTCTSENSATWKVATLPAGSTDHGEFSFSDVSSMALVVASPPVRSLAKNCVP